MTLKPNPATAAVIGMIHFGATFVISLLAAGQADSLGRPHGRGWIISADILAFPISAMWDTLQRHFSFSDGYATSILLVQSMCWGFFFTMLFSRRHDNAA
jgi:hypothetical protein